MKTPIKFFIIPLLGMMIANVTAQTVSISGTVKNSTGSLVSGALVCLKKYPGIQCYSAANGTFTLNATITGIEEVTGNEKYKIENGIVKIHADNEPVLIDVYDITGRFLKNITTCKNLSGYFEFPVKNIPAGNSAVLVLRIIVGQDNYSVKYLHHAHTLSDFPVQTTAENRPYKNTFATVDTLVITHGNYQQKKIALTGYTANIGNIIMSPANATSYSFSGGTLQDLKNASPALSFGTLEINGPLEIPSSENSVTITAANIVVNNSITVKYPTCSPYYDAPDLTLNVTGDVTINAVIYLSGKTGKGETTTTTCNSCTGTDGGILTINADNIYINERIDASGGWGSYSYITSSIKCGCNGGDGGKINLFANNIITVSQKGSDLDVEGGDAGGGSYECGDGNDGSRGIVDFEGQSITVNEISGDLNMLAYNAQIIDYEKLTLYGIIKYQEEFDHRNNYDAWYVSFSGGVGITLYDWLEDLFILRLESASTVKLSLTASNANADLDLYLLSGDMKTVIAQSNGATSSENINTATLAAGNYFIAISYADDGKNYSTNYTLKMKQ
ncbi:MAG: pre-peptidase C-terminal domain-containing protein [Bacteroidales bacterium]|nr:pre-peptidase C-terminal domain-containing protein [Bacteroidales bacterium]